MSTAGGMRWGALVAVALLAPALSARGQGASLVPQRGEATSGIRSRFDSIVPSLPSDGKRDTFRDTRWDDPVREPWYPEHPNCLLDGGLYGRPLPDCCVRTVWPFFQGGNQIDTLTEDCRPPGKFHRLPVNLLHPWRPVGMYYSGGSYVPIFDLDPLVPGPGPHPWGHFLKPSLGG